MRRLLPLLTLLLASAASAAPIDSGWPMFRANAQHASSTTATVPPHMKMRWNINLPENGFSSGVGEVPTSDYSVATWNNQRLRVGPSIGSGGILYVPYGEVLVAVHPSTGGILWASQPISPLPNGGNEGFTQPAIISTMVAAVPTELVIASSRGAVAAFRASDGSLIWSVNPRVSGIFSGRSPPTVGPDGTIFIGESTEGAGLGAATALYALNSSTGGVLWRYAPAGASLVGPPVLSQSGATIYAVVDATVHAVRAADGVLIASHTLGINTSDRGHSVVADQDGSVLVYNRISNSVNNTLLKYDLLAGATAWVSAENWTGTIAPRAPRQGPAYNSSAIFVNSGVDAKLSAINRATGATLWTRSHSDYAGGASPTNSNDGGSYPPSMDPQVTLVGDTTMFALIQSGWLVNIDPATGNMRWKYKFGNLGANTFQPQNMAGQVVVSSGGMTYLLFTPTGGDRGERRLVAFDDSGAAQISVSSAAPTVSGNVWTTTITVTVTDGVAAPVSGFPISLDSFSGSGVTITPSVNADSPNTATTSLGTVTYRVEADLSNIFHNQAISATAVVSGIGFSSVTVGIWETRASTYAVAVSTPGVEATTGGLFFISTITFTVSNSTGGRVPNFPVALDISNYLSASAGCTPASVTPNTHGGPLWTLTDSTGQAKVLYRLQMSDFGNRECYDSGQDINNYWGFDPRLSAWALGMSSTPVSLRDTSISTFTIALSTPIVQSDIRSSTITVTLYDALGSTLPARVVALNNLVGYGASGPMSARFNSSRTGAALDDHMIGYTDAFGKAVFHLEVDDRQGSGQFDSFDDHITSAAVFAFNIAPATATLTIESNRLDNFLVQVPSNVSVGVAFASTVTARNLYNHTLSFFNETAINLVPYIASTAVQGTGSLGTNLINFSSSKGRIFISNQTYNKIETIQIKAVRTSDNKEGFSQTLTVEGPARFDVDEPASATAGQMFVTTITAVDNQGRRIIGYTGTLSLTPLLASNTTQAGTGSLGVTNVNMSASGQVVVTNQTYNKGESIKIRAYDSALGVEGVSTTTLAVSLPPLTISHYRVSVPTQVTVGVPFRAQFIALDASSNPVTYQLSRSLNIQALLSLSPEISGSGSLGTSASSLALGTTNTLITNQTYNKIQTVYVKVTDEDGRIGISTNAVVFSGPTQFDVTIATYAQAGVQFQMIVTARDGGGQQVLGYDGTVAISAVQAGNTSLSGAGILGVTSINVASGLGVSPFQTYTKAEGIRLRLTDSAINVTSYSSSMTVRAGPAASMAVGANPQSTVATVPSVLTTTVLDQYSNAVQGTTVTYSVVAGSGVLSLSLSGGAVVSAVTTTNSVTNASGQAEAFFGSTNTLSSQANLLRVTLGALTADTTIYNAVLITSAGGAIVNLADPRIRVDCPANAWSFSIRMSAQGRGELSAADLAITTAAFAAQSNVFVSTVVAKLTAVRDSNPSLSAGVSPTKVNLSLPFEVTGTSQVTVGSYRGQSILVPLSVLRIFKLNSATSLFEMVLDGTNLADLSSRTVTAQLADPNGIYAIGAPPFTTLSAGSSGTVTAVLAAGATATVDVPFGAFAAATNLQVGVPSAASVPALPASRGITGTGLTISIQTTNSLQPSRPVTVNIGYRAQDVVGLNPDHLRLARYDESTGWVVLDSSVDTIARRVSGDTDHFSLFQIVAVAPRADLSSGIVFPNPFRPNAGHTMLKFGQLPALAKVRIFTVSGRLLKQLETDATGQVLSWDAKDKDGNVLPSGVYLALIESGSDRKTLKFAIQR